MNNLLNESKMNRRSALFAIFASVTASLNASESTTSSFPKLRNLMPKNGPLIGVCVPNNFDQIFSKDEIKLLSEQFNSVTPENSMKWSNINPGKDTYKFTVTDKLVQFAEQNNQKFIGHTLIFNRQGSIPKWIRNQLIETKDKKVLWKNIENYLEKVVTYYKGKVYAWDVLNEFIEAHPPYYRETDLTRVLGEDFPIKLFKLIAKLDPSAKLCYNDFSVENPERRKYILKFVQKLQDNGCQVDFIGSQGHFDLQNDVNQLVENCTKTIEDFSKLGIKTSFTEVDIDVIPRNEYWNLNKRAEVIKRDPFKEKCPDTILELQANTYKKFFSMVMANSKHVDRVTLWGLNDGNSWLNNWPWKRTNYGLLFDRNSKPKKAFHAVTRALQNI